MSSPAISTLQMALAHFTVAFVLASSFFFYVKGRQKKTEKHFETAGLWTFGLATATALLAVFVWVMTPEGTAPPSSETTTGEPSLYGALSAITVLVIVSFAVWLRRARKITRSHVIGSALVSVLTLITGIQGGLFFDTQDPAPEVDQVEQAANAPKVREHTSLFPPILEETINPVPQEAVELDENQKSAIDFVKTFHTALHTSDFEYTSGSFDPNAVIFENGIKEPTLSTYFTDHLRPEMVVLKAAGRQIIFQTAFATPEKALVTTNFILKFSVKGQPRAFNSVETLGLVRRGDRWLIEHAHWSSRPIIQ